MRAGNLKPESYRSMLTKKFLSGFCDMKISPATRNQNMYAANWLASNFCRLSTSNDMSRVTETAPKCIWLQVSDKRSDCDLPFVDHGLVPWHDKSEVACEVAYIRADLAADEITRLRALLVDAAPIVLNYTEQMQSLLMRPCLVAALRDLHARILAELERGKA